MLTHHAQLVEGGEEKFKSLLAQIEMKLGLGKTHPDLNIFSYIHEKLGIEDAARIRNAMLRNPTSTPQVITVIYAHTLTEVAQNSLLKIFEEPPQNSFVFLVTNFIPHLLPTLRSRFVGYEVEKSGNVSGIEKPVVKSVEKVAESLDVDNFLDGSIEKRLAIVKDIHAGLDKEKIRIDQVWDFVNEIERKVRIKVEENIHKDIDQAEEVLGVLMRTQEYMHTPGNSFKMLLEYLAVRV